MKRVSESHIVVTEHGPVLVSINPQAKGGFDPDLLVLGPVSEEARANAAFETPLRAFAVKVVDMIEAAGTDGQGVPPAMREMAVKEKATSELKRIERWSLKASSEG